MIGRRLLLGGGAAALAAPVRAGMPARIVAVGGAVTECAFALGAGEHVIAVDSTSRFPAAVRDLPQIGYMRALAPEGLIALHPDMLLLSEEAGPPQAVAVLRAAGAPIRAIPERPTGEGVAAKIRAVAAALGAPVAALRPVRAIFVLSAARGAPVASGGHTQAAAMMNACGAENAVTGFTGYRPLSAEAAAQMMPEAVIIMDHVLAELGGVDALLAVPALAVTPVARTRRVLAIDGSYVLGFGPRAAQARRDLTRLLHPDAALPDLPARAWT